MFSIISDPCSKVDILFILESTEAVIIDGTNGWKDLLNFVYNVVLITSDFADVHVGMIIYSYDALIRFGFGSLLSDTELYSAIRSAPFFSGDNNMEKALRLAREEILGQAGDRPGVPNIVILVSNGPFSGVTLFVENEANLIKENPSNRIIVVGVTARANYALLRKVVSHMNELYIATDKEEYGKILHPAIQGICQTYILPPKPDLCK